MNPDGTSRATIDLSDHEVVLVVKSRLTDRVDVMELEGSQMRLVIEAAQDVEAIYSWGGSPIRTVPTGPETLEVHIEGVTRYTTSRA